MRCVQSTQHSSHVTHLALLMSACDELDKSINGRIQTSAESGKKRKERGTRTTDLEWRTWFICTTFFSCRRILPCACVLAWPLAYFFFHYNINPINLIYSAFVDRIAIELKNKISSFFSFFFLKNRNISSKNSSFIIVPWAYTSSSQQCRIHRTDRWCFDGRKTYYRRTGPKSVCIGGAMHGACTATGSCWRTTWLEWYFEVTFSDWIIIITKDWFVDFWHFFLRLCVSCVCVCVSGQDCSNPPYTQFAP